MTLCHYTFHSNEIDSVAGFIVLCMMVIILLVAIFIWMSNKRDHYILNKKWNNRDAYLEEECEQYLLEQSKHDLTLRSIREKYNWKQWFIKGHRQGAIWGNGFSDKTHAESSFEEWEEYELAQMSHIKDNSDYFGGSKKNAQLAYILGHELGVMRYDEKGPAD